jgi:hypothetical protein
MANTSTGRPGTETSDYSATIAPENSRHVTAEARAGGATLKPGGAHGAPVDVGMSELHRENVPSQADDGEHSQSADRPADERATRTGSDTH